MASIDESFELFSRSEGSIKGSGAADLAACASTTSRWGQRLVVAVATQRGSASHSMRVEKEFLQRLSYEELAEHIGEELRHVYIRLPIRCVASLRQLKRYREFSPTIRYCIPSNWTQGFATHRGVFVANSRNAPPPLGACPSWSTTRWSACTEAGVSS